MGIDDGHYRSLCRRQECGFIIYLLHGAVLKGELVSGTFARFEGWGMGKRAGKGQVVRRLQFFQVLLVRKQGMPGQ